MLVVSVSGSCELLFLQPLQFLDRHATLLKLVAALLAYLNDGVHVSLSDREHIGQLLVQLQVQVQVLTFWVSLWD